MSMIIRNHIRYASGGNGGDPSVEITQAEYDELVSTNSIQKDVTYYITDSKDEFDASFVKYDNTESGLTSDNMQDAINELKSNLETCFQSVSNGKILLASAITDMGVETDANASFEEMVANIRSIETGIDTSDGTATAADITEGKIAYSCNQRIVGERPAAPKTLSGTFYQGIGEGYATYKYRIDFNPPFDVVPKFTYNMQLGNNDTTGSLLYVERDHAMFQVVHSHGNETSSCRITWTATVQ